MAVARLCRMSSRATSQSPAARNVSPQCGGGREQCSLTPLFLPLHLAVPLSLSPILSLSLSLSLPFLPSPALSTCR